MKRCTRCGVEKPLTAFQADSRRSDGRKARCKACVRKRKPTSVDIHAWLGLPEDASIKVEASLPYGMKPATYALGLVRRDSQARWKWHHVHENGDYWCLELRVELGGIDVQMGWMSHWTREQARWLDAELRSVCGEEIETARLPPAMMAYAVSECSGGQS